MDTDKDPNPAHKLGYQNPSSPRGSDPMTEDRRGLRGFAMGFFAGVGVSILLYCFTPMRNDADLLYRPITIAILKFVVALACLFYKRSRPFGLGLLFSIAIGFLILFGAICGGMRTWK